MASEGFKRKLTAILSADVAGYSRLMRDDEEATVRTLNSYKEMIFELIVRNQGRLVDSTGDNILAEFSSVVDAVRCAVQIQEDSKTKNERFPESRKMKFRIGINTGDIIIEGDRIYGDGVNVAARIESLADAGGICISRSAYDQVKRKLNFKYEDIGEHQVKNIDEPVRVYKVLMEPVSGEILTKERSQELGSKERLVDLLSDKPSIAVLPFVNMSNDPEQEYFSDGMAEELIGALAKLKGLKVISRTSAFYFKGQQVDLRTIGEKLKVDNVLEGSVRKAGNRLRISAQLIKVADDTHLWSETYDRQLSDVFAIQDEISQEVVRNLKVKLLGTKIEPLVKDFTKNTEAYELYLRGVYFWNKGFLYWQKSIECFEKAIKSAPEYTPAYLHLVNSYYGDTIFRSLPPNEMWQEVKKLILKAFEIDKTDFWVQMGLAWLKGLYDYDWKDLRTFSKQSIELFPGRCESHWRYATTSIAAGRLNEAIKAMKLALELDPFSSMYNNMLGLLLVCDNQFEQAVLQLKKTLELTPNDPHTLGSLAYAYAGKGIYVEGIKSLQEFRNIPILASILGYLYAKAGMREEAQQILADFLDRSKRGYFSTYYIAYVYTGLGEKDNAFEWLEEVYQERNPNNWLIRVDPVFTNLHSDPRWTKLMEKMGLAD